MMINENSDFNKKLLRLTPQVRKTVLVLLTGKSNKEIAKTMSLAKSTVEQHLSIAYKKFRVNDRTQLVIELLS